MASPAFTAAHYGAQARRAAGRPHVAAAERSERRRARLRGLLIGTAFLLSHVYLPLIALVAADILFARRGRPLTRTSLAIGCIAIFCAVLEIVSASIHSTGRPAIPAAIVGTLVILQALWISQTDRRQLPELVTAFMLTTMMGNFLAFAAGLQGSSTYFALSQNQMGDFFGIEKRVFFFFSNGTNAYGTLAGLFFTVSVFIYVQSRSRLAALSALAAIASIVMVDSRGALAFSVLAILIRYMLPIRRYAPAIAISTIAVPLLALAYPDVVTDIVGAFSRPGTDASSGRLLYWNTIIAYLPWEPQKILFGAGLNGTSTMAIPAIALRDFSNYVISDGVIPGAHNMWLQIFVDGGLIKLIFYLSVFAICIRNIHRNGAPFSMQYGILYVLLAGMSESALDYNRIEFLFVLFILIGLSLPADRPAPQPPMKVGRN